jgi:hypothetical protein
MHTTATHICRERSGQTPALAPVPSTAAPAAPAPAATVAPVPVSAGMAAATEDVYQGGGLQLLGSLFMGQMTETMPHPLLNDADTADTSPDISSPTFCLNGLFFSNGTSADNNGKVKNEDDDAPKDEDTEVFQDANKEHAPSVESEDSEDGKEGKCPECGDNGPIYNYCFNCEDSGMTYEEIPWTDDIPSTNSDDEKEGSQEGTCPKCNLAGRAGDSCSHCQDSILLNFQAGL